MVAYLGLLEEMILAAPQTFYRYIGWENGVQSFRNDYRNQPWRLRFRWHLEGLRWGIARLLMFSTTQRYWIFCWYTFFGSGLLALLLGHWSGATFHSLAWLLACILFAAVALQTIKVLGSLTDGMHSFRRNADFWRSVLAGNGQKSKGKTS
jgi:hypothetical protein